ncbi:LysR family transcriptional regulator [Frigidibacter sp. ROC022]|uniref:LysR family transcriptional regulator n=1 Tax=Frigidibacter sp. ROC022 TaxID=2971796 RepID=UPI00215B59F1|nr:LysR family transcriptional regulator [Frigidibacter sp. ROC022]MCR8724541.1 LysR family transcriptional regulator [Frigidibacter sp. ROC022]
MADYLEIPNIRHLRMAQAIGRFAGVSSASRHLNVSQPAVTQAIANLEKRLGTEIFYRRATGTYVTDTGKRFLLRVDRFFEILEGAIYCILKIPGEQPDRHLPRVEQFVTTTQLKALVVASEPATLEVAAAAMNMSVASLHRSARALERSLGVPLLERAARGNVCNPAGEFLAREVRRAAREIEFGRAEITLDHDNEDLEIIVGILPMAGTYELASGIRRFAKAHPSTRVTIQSGTYRALLDDLQNCRIDMIFGLLHSPDWEPEIEEELLYTDSYCVVCRPGHPLTRLREITAKALVDYDWIVPAKRTQRRRNIEALFASTVGQPRGNIEVNSYNCTRTLLLESDMVTVMSCSEVRLDAMLGTLTLIPCAGLGGVMPKGVTTRLGWLSTTRHEQFLECLRYETANTTYGTMRRPEVVLAS